MIIEIGNNLGFVTMVVGIVWAVAWAFRGFHMSMQKS